MPNKYKKHHLSIYTTLSIFLLSILYQPASIALDLKDFNVISTRVNERGDFRENYIKLKSLISVVNEKVNKHAKFFKNTNYKQSKKDVALAAIALNDADTAFSTGEKAKAKHFVNVALENLRTAQLNLMPSRVAEARGLYIDADSIPKSKYEITRLMKTLKKANFNIIYPEVFRRGYAIVTNNITEIDPNFKELNFDALSYLIEEAHHNGIEVHPWIWTFRVKSPNYGNPILGKYSDLMATKEVYKPFDRQPLFLSPAAPQARQLIAKLLKFIATNYDIDGLLLDYIRYDETNNEDILSKKYFRLYYLDKYKVEPPVNIDRKDPIFVEWQLWRESQVTTMVELIKKEINSVKPDLIIGASVFRTEGEGRLLKMQDWRLWASNHLIEYVCPMLYTNVSNDINYWLDSETDRETRNDFLYVSLGAHKFITPDDLYQQYGILSKRNIPGLNIFALTHYNRDNFLDLSKSIFRKPAILPHKNVLKSIKLTLKDTSDWLKRLSYDEKSLPANELNNLAYQFNQLNNTIPDKKNYKDYFKLNAKLSNLKDTVDSYSKVKNFSPYFLEEIKEPIDYSQRLLKIFSVEMLTKNKTFISSLPPLPILAETKPLPIVDIYPTSVAPNIDGTIESDLWYKYLPLRGFYWHLGSFRAEVETVVKMTYGKEYLYISFENYEPNMKKTVKVAHDHNSEQIINDDSVEVFLKVPGIKDYYQFAVNMNNAQLEKKINKKSWHSKWSSGVKVEDEKWSVEFKIPFSDLNFVPNSGEVLKANFVRNRPQETDPHSHWSPTYYSPYTPSRFGSIVFR